MMSKPFLRSSRIVIADDQEANVHLLTYILESAEYTNFKGMTDARDVLPECKQQTPDLLLLDLHMPHLDGVDLIQAVASQFPDEAYLPILVLTADITPEAKKRTLSAGAKDFLSKPLDAMEVLLRVNNLLETRALYKQIAQHSHTLEEKVRERTCQLAQAQVEILQRLALAAEYRDDDTGQHTQRVGILSAMLARAVGQSDHEVELLRMAAPLHDVGKIGIPDRVLLKPGKLTTEEFTIMQSHTTIGREILGGSKFSILQLASQIALSHHERWDGLGYPQRIAGEMIPLAARITAVADVFDALTHARTYKEAWPLEKAAETIQKESGRHFDPNSLTLLWRSCPAERPEARPDGAAEAAYSSVSRTSVAHGDPGGLRGAGRGPWGQSGPRVHQRDRRERPVGAAPPPRGAGFAAAGSNVGRKSASLRPWGCRADHPGRRQGAPPPPSARRTTRLQSTASAKARSDLCVVVESRPARVEPEVGHRGEVGRGAGVAAGVRLEPDPGCVPGPTGVQSRVLALKTSTGTPGEVRALRAAGERWRGRPVAVVRVS